MLDTKFCEFLEYEISKALANSIDDYLKGFWCDGILLPTFENEYSKKFVNDNRKIVIIAFIGSSGQDKYELTKKFALLQNPKYPLSIHSTFYNKLCRRHSFGIISTCQTNSSCSRLFDLNFGFGFAIGLLAFAGASATRLFVFS